MARWTYENGDLRDPQGRVVATLFDGDEPHLATKWRRNTPAHIKEAQTQEADELGRKLADAMNREEDRQC